MGHARHFSLDLGVYPGLSSATYSSEKRASKPLPVPLLASFGMGHRRKMLVYRCKGCIKEKNREEIKEEMLPATCDIATEMT